MKSLTLCFYPKKILFIILLVSYGSCLFYCMFLGFHREILWEEEKFLYNCTPFKTISYFMDLVLNFKYLKFAVVNLVGNIIGFVPIGFLLPAVFYRLKSRKLFSIVFIILITIIELLQMISHTGVADIDDILLNYLGAIIGFSIYIYFYKRRSYFKEVYALSSF